MSRKINGILEKLGTSPGSVVYNGKDQKEESTIKAFSFDAEKVDVLDADINNLPEVSPNKVLWIQFRGIHNVDAVKTLSDKYGIHTLIQEDICNVEQGTSGQYLDGVWAITLRHLFYKENNLVSAHMSCIVKKNLVISFVESCQADNLLEPIELRLQDPEKQIRGRGAYYISYTILDLFVDYYQLALAKLELQIELLDENITENIDIKKVDYLHDLRKQLLQIRKPAQELLVVFEDLNEEVMKECEPLTDYLNDMRDHLRGVANGVHLNLDKLSSLFDLYYSLISFDMNKTMQFLAVISIVFLPLTLLTGVFGMNFKYIPGLDSDYGFYVFAVVSVISLVGILTFFKKKRWF